MRVNQPVTSTNSGGVGAAGAVRTGAGFTVGLHAATERPAARGPIAAAPLASLDAILALQDQPDSSERRRRAVRRGEGLLERLEVLRANLLDGAVTADGLDRLRQALEQPIAPPDDPALAEILAEIELRTAVELAKLGSAYGMPTC